MCNCILRIFILAVGLFLFVPHLAQAQSTNIQMLPPTAYNSPNPNSCTYTSGSVLVLGGSGTDGNSAISCNANFLADPSTGNVTANGSLTLGGSETFLGGLHGNQTVTNQDVYTLNQLQTAGSACTGYQALTENAQNQITCIDVTDLYNSSGTPIGKTIMPSCPNGVLTSLDGLTFTCEQCGPGSAITRSASGGLTCQALPFNISCSAGNVMTGIDNNGMPICTALPVPPVVGANPLYISTYIYDDPNSFNADLVTGLISTWGAPPNTGNVNSTNEWNVCNVSDPTSDSLIASIAGDTNCMLTMCYGHFGKYPTIAQSNGFCAAGDTNPVCNGQNGTGVHMDITINCEYTQ